MRAALVLINELAVSARLAALVVIAAMLLAGGLIRPALAGDTAGTDIIAHNIRLISDGGRTRFIAEFSQPVEFQHYMLENPYRVVIDLTNVQFRLPSGIGRRGAGVVRSFRYGVYAPGKARIVIDVREPVSVLGAAIERSAGRNAPARLVLDLVGESIDWAPAVKNKLPAATKRTGNDKQRRSGWINPVIILDAGHGGNDSGATSKSGTLEKNIVLAVSKQLGQKLKKSGRYKVIYTRKSDVFVSLTKRVRIARKHGKHGRSLMISLHADYLPERYAKQVRGATIYMQSKKASDEVAQLIAKNQNESDFVAGLPIPDVHDQYAEDTLADWLQDENKRWTQFFGTILRDKISDKTGMKRRRVRSAAFVVLKSPDVPSILLELGYISNRQDEKQLKSPKWRKRLTNAIYSAIEDYFVQRDFDDGGGNAGHSLDLAIGLKN